MLNLTVNSKTKFEKNIPNCFGLTYGLPENGGTCPGATLGDGGCLHIRDNHKRPTCYMAKVTQIYKAVGNVLIKNTELLLNKSQDELEIILDNTIKDFIKKSKNKNLFFRLHYSGDFFSEEYAKAWSEVILNYPSIRFWVYSRSHSFGKFFKKCKNLTFYYSVDVVNFKTALKYYKEVENLPNFGLAWLGTEEPPDKEKYRWVICPETSGKIKNTENFGACSKCRLCVDNYKSKVKNICFKIH